MISEEMKEMFEFDTIEAAPVYSAFSPITTFYISF